jgi:hypothetical protein
MKPAHRILLLYVAPVIALAAAAAAYGYFVGFPKTINGRRVHRITHRETGDAQATVVYYAYNAAGKEMRHGPFQRFEHGIMTQSAFYNEGKLDGTQVFFDMLGEKTEEVYYHNGQPYGWANFMQGKLYKMRKQIFQQERPVAVEALFNGKYYLQFSCGELINLQIDADSGELKPIPQPTKHACVEP